MLDVIVLTAFGREAWLVKKLKEHKLQFQSVDVTAYFKQDDVAFTVPFGMSLGKDQNDILKCGYIFNKQFQGWSAISDRGVVESNGFLKDFQLERRGELAQRFYAHQFSTYDFPFGVLIEKPQELTVPYSTYECVNFPESLKVRAGEPLSIQLRAGGQFVEYAGESYKAPYMINLLDPYMCRELENKGVSCSELAHTRKIDPLYIWYPWRVTCTNAQHLSHMPKQTLLVAEAAKPWFEDNFIVINKEASSNEFVAWTKVIFDLQKTKKYLSDISSRTLAQLEAQLKMEGAQIHHHFAGTEHGLSPYPVYDLDEILLYKKWYDRGVYHGGFEVCDAFTLDEQIRVQTLIVNGLLEENERDRQIHP